ncbi:MAG: ATP-binding cassette domain-containing protein [Congregibacter sp.]
MSAEPPIQLKDVSYVYGKDELEKQTLFDISLTVEPGEIVILTGPSGSGKTTLLTLIGALRAAQHGSVMVLGGELKGASQRQLTRARRNVGYIFQSHNLLSSLSVRQNVQMALNLGAPLKRSADRIVSILDRVGLGEQIDAYPGQLSGGQKQRAGIARALVNRPRVVLADEPTASLDKHAGRSVVELIQDLAREEGTAVVLVTHDNRILDIADRILYLEDGRLRPTGEAVVERTSQLLHLLEKHSPSTAGYLAAFAFALARVVYADNLVVESEREEARRILSETASLSSGEIEFILEMALIQGRSHRRDSALPEASDATELLSSDRRQHFLDSLYAIADADGSLNEQEAEEIRVIATEFGL